MKLIILLLLAIIFTKASAQVTAPHPNFPVLPQPKLKTPLFFIDSNSTKPKAMFVAKTRIGNIYTLPLDHMPCLVADKKMLTAMPNAAPEAFSMSIPNPYLKEKK